MEEGALITSADVPALFLRYHGVLVGYAARRVGIDQAEDLVQLAWLRVLGALHERRPIRQAAVQTYLYKVVKRLVIDWLRREQVVLLLPLFDEAEVCAVDGPEEATCQRDEIRRALGQRSAEECWILAWVLQGYSLAEIGERLHLSEDAVKQHLYRVRQATKRWRERMAS